MVYGSDVDPHEDEMDAQCEMDLDPVFPPLDASKIKDASGLSPPMIECLQGMVRAADTYLKIVDFCNGKKVP
jgi:hypothetical protein